MQVSMYSFIKVPSLKIYVAPLESCTIYVHLGNFQQKPNFFASIRNMPHWIWISIRILVHRKSKPKHPLVNSSLDISRGSLFGLLATLIWVTILSTPIDMRTHQIKLRNFQWDFSRLVAQSSYDCGHNQSNGPCGSCQRYQLPARKCVGSFWGRFW